MKSILWKQPSRHDESIYMVFAHPSQSFVATVSTDWRISIWLYDFTESIPQKLQTFKEGAPGTRITNAVFSYDTLENKVGNLEIALGIKFPHFSKV